MYFKILPFSLKNVIPIQRTIHTCIVQTTKRVGLLKGLSDSEGVAVQSNLNLPLESLDSVKRQRCQLKNPILHADITY